MIQYNLFFEKCHILIYLYTNLYINNNIAHNNTKSKRDRNPYKINRKTRYANSPHNDVMKYSLILRIEINIWVNVMIRYKQ